MALRFWLMDFRPTTSWRHAMKLWDLCNEQQLEGQGVLFQGPEDTMIRGGAP
jgi:hypothetical protein